MSENDEILIKETNTNSQSKIWKRIIAILFMFSGFVGLMTCFYLMIQLFINHQQLLELSFLEYSFKPGLELLAYSSSIFFIVGFLALMLAAGVDLFFEAS